MNRRIGESSRVLLHIFDSTLTIFACVLHLSELTVYQAAQQRDHRRAAKGPSVEDLTRHLQVSSTRARPSFSRRVSLVAPADCRCPPPPQLELQRSRDAASDLQGLRHAVEDVQETLAGGIVSPFYFHLNAFASSQPIVSSFSRSRSHHPQPPRSTLTTRRKPSHQRTSNPFTARSQKLNPPSRKPALASPSSRGVSPSRRASDWRSTSSGHASKDCKVVRTRWKTPRTGTMTTTGRA